MQKNLYIDPIVDKQLVGMMGNIIKENTDKTLLIDGPEGSGKSLLGIQIGYRCSQLLGSKFSPEDVCIGGEKFKDRIKYYAKRNIKRRVILFDEAFTGLSSRSALSKKNKELIRLFLEVRQFNHVIIIILPSFFLLEKYIAAFRTTGLFHVDFDKRSGRRYYKTYNKDAKQLLYIKGKANMSYSYPHVPLKHTFNGQYPPGFNEEDMYKDKRIAFLVDDDATGDKKYMMQRNILVKFLHDKGFTYKEISKAVIDGGGSLKVSNIGTICQKTQ